MRIEKVLSTVDTHTAGGPTRIVTSGVPEQEGDSTAAKMASFQSRYDWIRDLLMREPRGHRNMSGAVLTRCTNAEADISAFFITPSGYLPACVHSTIGVAVAGLKCGFLATERLIATGRIVMEVPSGLVYLVPEYEDDRLRAMMVQTAPAFVLTLDAEVRLRQSFSIAISIVFSGVFFALVDLEQLKGLDRNPIPKLSAEFTSDWVSLAFEVLEAVNQQCHVGHPERPDLQTVDFVMFYRREDRDRARDIVINSGGGVDRTPCGAGMGAMLANLTQREQLKIGDRYVLESFIGTEFAGRVKDSTRVGEYQAIIPQIEGMAYVTGIHQFLLESDDPLRNGLHI